MSPRPAACAALAVASVLACSIAPRLASAQGAAFAGTWTIRAWRAAPWLDSVAARRVQPDAGLLGHQVTFTAGRVAGPTVLACRHPAYEVKDVPFDGLFEGGLTKPDAQARALGYTSPRVRTLMPGCDFEFHLRATDTALFALDNVLFTMVRRHPATTR